MVASKQMLKIFQKHLLYRELEFRYSLVMISNGRQND